MKPLRYAVFFLILGVGLGLYCSIVYNESTKSFGFESFPLLAWAGTALWGLIVIFLALYVSKEVDA